MDDQTLLNQLRIRQVQYFIDRMPSLSTTVTKVLEVCNRPDISANDLNRVISLDPVLTGQVMKLINSAYYSLPNQITSLTRAIIMLGPNTVKNMALSTAILATIGRTESFKALSIDEFWSHSLCVGVVAKAIAAMRGVAQPLREEYFIAGLLHDLGKIPLNHRFVKEYGRALAQTRADKGVLVQAETAILGLDHGLVGEMIARKWQLNRNSTEALAYHHHPFQAAEENRELVATIALANVYANVYDIGTAGDHFPAPEEITSLLDLLGLTWNDLEPLQELVTGEIGKARVFLQISGESKKA